MIGHGRAREMLARRAELTPRDERRLQEHVEQCPECLRLAADYALQNRLLSALPQAAPPPGLRQSVLNSIDKTAAPHPARFFLPRWSAGLAAVAVLSGVVALVVVSQPRSVPQHRAVGPVPTPPAVTRTPEVTAHRYRLSGGAGATKHPVQQRVKKASVPRVIAPAAPSSPPGSLAWVPVSHAPTPPAPSPVPTAPLEPRQSLASVSPPRNLLSAPRPLPSHVPSPRSGIRPPLPGPVQRSASPTPEPPAPVLAAAPRPPGSAVTATSVPLPVATTGASAVPSTPFPIPTMPATPTPIPLRLPAYVPAPPLDTPTPLITPIP